MSKENYVLLQFSIKTSSHSRLNKLGFHVISGCLSQKGADDLKQLCPEKLSTVVMDVTIGDNIEKAFNFVKELLPHKQGLFLMFE